MHIQLREHVLASALTQLHVQMHCSGLEVATVTRETRNGMSATHLRGAAWRKSTRSGAQGNCVELAALDTGEIAVRNSRDPDGPALIYTGAEMAAFLAGARDGEFDHLLG